ncbi:YihY/virulence factor BrkB family protein [Oleiharenicola lentus]|uniref:YihY/virulence factor BrkB family protein n=1 Tax=Oleiharenicola lentus TaxID=2508720 RepID=A0A4Q1CCI9_9BACT|nr:YihY/virulence factor BrkB family protein [Oleiharenicola lentus]RXK56867.1 YihY/virulence factor BrkB family protein [Oleiharenicola lentus]
MPAAALLQRLRQLWQEDIWSASFNRDRTIRNRFYALLRIVSITISGLHELKVATRAAALSYSSLLGLGPLIAIAVLISGFALGNRDPAIMAQKLNSIIGFIAPQVAQYDHPEEDGTLELRPVTVGADGRPVVAATADPELVKLITQFISSSRSGAAGVIGVFALLIIVLQLFTSIENTFNDIWGVRRGRGWLTRIIYYWTTVTLGAVLFFASITLVSATAFLTVFAQFAAKLPLGAHLVEFVNWLLPSSSFLLLMSLLMLFYRTVPNTRVKWGAALIGAIVVTGLLFLNNYVAFLYLQGVFRTKSLYGSVGIFPILMAGLYIFWFFVLVGGQITYAVQNVRYRSSQTAWHNLNHATRESMSLVVLLLVARRFKACAPAYSVTELAHLIRIPSQILNESLNRLCDLGLIDELPPAEGSDPNDHRYQPARPLDKITLSDFREKFENYGEAPSGGLLDHVDPVLAHYHAKLATGIPAALGAKTLDDLITEQEPSATYAPFPTTAK